MILRVGGGFKYFWNFHPEPWGRWTHFDSYFSKGLVQPPTGIFLGGALFPSDSHQGCRPRRISFRDPFGIPPKHRDLDPEKKYLVHWKLTYPLKNDGWKMWIHNGRANLVIFVRKLHHLKVSNCPFKGLVLCFFPTTKTKQTSPLPTKLIYIGI